MAKNWKETKRKNVNISAIIPNLGSILLFLGGGEGGEIISYFHLILSARWNKTRSWSGYLQTMHKAVSLFKFSWCLKSIYFNCTISIFLPIYFLLYFSFGDTSRNATLKSGLQKRHEYDDDDFFRTKRYISFLRSKFTLFQSASLHLFQGLSKHFVLTK